MPKSIRYLVSSSVNAKLKYNSFELEEKTIITFSTIPECKSIKINYTLSI